MNNQNLSSFETIINYKFKNISVLKLALTHSSYANERKSEKYRNNERIEFLGDAVLDLVVSRYIYNAYPDMPEGELTKLRAGVVCEGSIAEKAREIHLGDYIMLGRGEESTGGRTRDSVLADAFESVIGAVFLDGGMDAVEKYVLSIMTDEILKMKNAFKTMDCKTRLQEVMQKVSKHPIHYEIVSETGPDHNKIFVAEVSHDGKVLGSGEGKSKKEAEQSAACHALEIIN